jgi:hypothetical protein
MSVTHSSFGRFRRNFRPTKSSDGTRESFAPLGNRRRGNPFRPRLRMMSPTALWPTWSPRPSFSSAGIRSAP